jgi:hypothetical protein
LFLWLYLCWASVGPLVGLHVEPQFGFLGEPLVEHQLRFLVGLLVELQAVLQVEPQFGFLVGFLVEIQVGPQFGFLVQLPVELQIGRLVGPQVGTQIGLQVEHHFDVHFSISNITSGSLVSIPLLKHQVLFVAVHR